MFETAKTNKSEDRLVPIYKSLVSSESHSPSPVGTCILSRSEFRWPPARISLSSWLRASEAASQPCCNRSTALTQLVK